MTAVLWIRVAAGMVFTLGMGHVLIRAFRFSESPWLHNWASYYLAGQVCVTVLTLATAYLPFDLGVASAAAVCGVTGYWLFALFGRRLGEGVSRELPRAAGALGLTMLFFPWAVVLLHELPVVDWDARSIWFFHGKALFVDQGVDPAFFSNPLYTWSHPDYPLMLPAQAAWTSLFVGAWDEVAAKGFLLFNLAAYLHLLSLTLRLRGFPWWLGLALAILLLDQNAYGYINGYADNHVVLPLTLCLLLFGLRQKPGVVPLQVLLLAYASNTKNEGLAYALVTAGVLWGAARLPWPRGESPQPRGVRTPSTRTAAWLCLVWGLPVAMWLTFRYSYGLRSSDLEMLPSLQDLVMPGAALGDRAAVILAYFGEWFMRHATLWVIGVVLVSESARAVYRALRAEPWGVGMEERVLFLYLLGLTAGIFAVFLGTPHDLDWHLRSAARRLLHFPHMVACVMAVVWFEHRLLDRLLSTDERGGRCG